VNFKPNYDAQLTEPEVLPAAFPNLLVNGASGIAVGMATNMPPHNLREVIAAARYLLGHPDASLEDLMKYVPGPDLPTGGIIVGLDGIKEAYATGRGVFKTRAKVSIESVSPRKLGLVVSELPYLVGPEKVIEKIKDGVNSKKLQGISDVTDLTDRANGLKLVIGLKTGFDPEVVLDLLYRFTPLEDSFGINNVALVNGRPATLGLRDLLGVYLAHRIVVTRRRSQNRLGKRQARLHLVEGLLLAILDIDRVIKLIRESDEVDEARQKLRDSFGLSELQAEYILELRLRRLTKFSRIELETERDTLRQEIAELERILASDQALRDLVSAELEEVADKYGDPRRTTLMSESEDVKPLSAAKAASVDAELADGPCYFALTASGRMARLPENPGVSASKRSRHDALSVHFTTSTRSDLVFVTSAGRGLRIHAADVPPAESIQANDSFVAADGFLGLKPGERLLTVVEANENNQLALGTAQGVVKRVLADYPTKDEFELIGLKEGDEVVGAALATDTSELIFVTSDAQLLHYSASVVRPQGRPAGGMAGINVTEGAKVIYFGAVDKAEDAVVLTAANSSAALVGTDAGSAKLSLLDEFPAKGRATGGVRAQRFVRGEDQLYFAWVGTAEPRGLTSDGKPVELPLEPMKRDASGSALAGVIASVGQARTE
jgi:DNA gyrase subunit A